MVLLKVMAIIIAIIINLPKQGFYTMPPKLKHKILHKNNFTGYYDIETVLENMGITNFNKILESNYIPYDATGVVRAKLIGYGTTLLYSSNQHYVFARYYTKDGNKGAWATSEFQKGDYITGSLIFT